MLTRKNIRDAVKAALAKAPFTGAIFTVRRVDVREGTPEYVKVYLNDAEIVQEDGLGQFTHAELVIEYNKSGTPSDDDLDTVADALNAALFANIESELAGLGLSITGLIPTGWTYADDEEKAFSSIEQTYTVVY
jgi:hypothetical protein